MVAIDGAFGWSTHDHTDFYMQSDLLWHNFDLIPVSQGRMPVYFGAGGLLRFRNSGEDDQFGIRAPVGVSYLFDSAPVDIFRGSRAGPRFDARRSWRSHRRHWYPLLVLIILTKQPRKVGAGVCPRPFYFNISSSAGSMASAQI